MKFSKLYHFSIRKSNLLFFTFISFFSFAEPEFSQDKRLLLLQLKARTNHETESVIIYNNKGVHRSFSHSVDYTVPENSGGFPMVTGDYVEISGYAEDYQHKHTWIYLTLTVQ